jgi:hypothetical protein
MEIQNILMDFISLNILFNTSVLLYGYLYPCNDKMK